MLLINLIIFVNMGCLELVLGFLFFVCKGHLFIIYVFFDSDITALAKDRAYTHINLDDMTIQQVTAVTSF